VTILRDLEFERLYQRRCADDKKSPWTNPYATLFAKPVANNPFDFTALTLQAWIVATLLQLAAFAFTKYSSAVIQ
jgi:hypothetical protein